MKKFKCDCKSDRDFVKNRLKSRIIPILLILSFCLVFAVSCKTPDKDPVDSQTGDVTASDPGTNVILADGETSEFRIVRPANCDDYVKSLANKIREDIKRESGVNIRVFTDATPASGEIREILVGKTNRPQSAAAYQDLKYNDWRIAAEQRTVAIAAFKEDNLEFAIDRFLGKTKTEGKTVSYHPFSEEKLRVYDVSELSFGGTDFAMYTIVCSDPAESDFARRVRDLIAEYNGNYLDIVEQDSDIGSGKKPFYIGSAYYGGAESDRETTAYCCKPYGEGMSLWFCDSSACLDAMLHLEKGLKNAGVKADLEDCLPGKNQIVKEENMNLKILSFNVQNGWNTNQIGNRDDLIAGKILQQLPDVIGFQEFDPFYREAERPLTEMIASKYQEVNVTGGSTAMEMSWNPIFYNPERLTPKMFGSEDYRDGTSYVYPHGGRSKFRTISWVVFEDNVSKQNFLFISTHYDMNTDTTVRDNNQTSQAVQLVELVTRLKKSYGVQTVFVAGDYNASASGVPSLVMKNAGFGDTWNLAQTKDDVNSCGNVGEPTEGPYSWAIDHVFYMANSITVQNYQTVTDIRDASDHCPVFVTLTVNSR